MWVLFRYRHLMLNVASLLPHSKRDNKVESKESKGATLNELVELKSCSSCLFFEVLAPSVLNPNIWYLIQLYAAYFVSV